MHLCERCDPGSIPGGPRFKYINNMQLRNFRFKLQFRFYLYVAWIVIFCFLLVWIFFFFNKKESTLQIEETYITNIENLKEWSQIWLKWIISKGNVLWDDVYALISSDWIKFVILLWEEWLWLPLGEIVVFTWKVEYFKWSIPYITIVR